MDSITVNIVSIIVLILIGMVTVFMQKRTSDEQIKNQNKINYEKQLGMLNGLKQQLWIIENNIEGHQEKVLKHGQSKKLVIPAYFINEIEPKYYATGLRTSVNGKPTDELKKLLFQINDKIRQINETIKRIENLYYFGHPKEAINLRNAFIRPIEGENIYEKLKILLKKAKEEVDFLTE